MSQGKHRELFGHEDIARTFSYEPENGKLFRRLPDGTIRQMRVAIERPDSRSDVAITIDFRGYRIRSTHIIFMLVEKRWPRERHVMDHRDGDVFNCRWSNLREATRSQNNMNREASGRWALRMP
jgi:hypothetical protein